MNCSCDLIFSTSCDYVCYADLWAALLTALLRQVAHGTELCALLCDLTKYIETHLPAKPPNERVWDLEHEVRVALNALGLK